MQKTNPLKRLVKKNQKHHNTIINFSPRSLALKKAVAQRQKYVAQLSKLPFFKKVILKRQSFALDVKGEARNYQLCLTGIKQADLMIPDFPLGKIPTKMAFIFDPLGRIRFFCKTTHPAIKNPQWAEMRGFIGRKIFGNVIVQTKERVLHASDMEEFTEIKNLLEKEEKNILFEGKIGARELQKLQALL